MPRFDPDWLHALEPDPAARDSVASHLLDAVRQVEDAKFHLAIVRYALSQAEESSGVVGRPSQDIVMLGNEVDVLIDLLDEKEVELIQRIATEETGSFG
jgi:hypothetical protein